MGSAVSSEFGGRTLAILSFHKVGEPSPDSWRSWFYTPEQAFVGCLRYLRENGWPVIDVTRRSIEETAYAIVKLCNERMDAAAEAAGT